MAPELVIPQPVSADARRVLAGRYELIAKIGTGGMARVYLALQRSGIATKLVVVKELRPELLDDDGFRTMFLDEARIALRLSHPNVVACHEVETGEQQQFFLVMEYLEGRPLSQLLKRVGRGRMPLNAHLWLLCEVLAGLHYSHELADLDGTPLKLVHRDVSPSNVLITSRGEVKLLDFGIAKAAGALAQTQFGVLKGKLGYASPEQLAGQRVDARTDVYAVGVMLWEAIAGRRRTSAETPAAAMQARLESLEPELEVIKSDVPKKLLAITRQALALDPEDRFPSAHAMRTALLSYLRSHSARDEASPRQALLAHLIRTQFAEELEQTREIIRASPSRHPPSKLAHLEMLDETDADPGTPRAVDRSGFEAIRTPRARKARAVGGLLSLGLLVAFGVFAASWFQAGGRFETSGDAARLSPTAGATPTAVSTSQDVDVNIVVSPSSAVLTLDGSEIENPYQRRHKSDAAEHKLVATAPGYRTSMRPIALTEDVEIVFTLEPLPATADTIPSEPVAPRRRIRKPSPPSTVRPPQTPVVGPDDTAKEPEERTPSSEGTAKPPPVPGMDLRREDPPREQRTLDEGDPFAP